MLKKYGKYYADWKSAEGSRKRKAFPTRKAALQFQQQMREGVALKKARARAALLRSSARGRKGSQKAATRHARSRANSRKKYARKAS